MEFIDLFAGIGGISLGLERAGMECVAQIEIDDFCQKMLAKHWPDVPKFKDVKDVGKYNLPTADLICGGVPCQSISQAASRSERGNGWLWPEMMRVINELEPRWVIFENPEAIRFQNRGLGIIIRDLTENGFDYFWDILSAAEFGAPHKRARLWLVANSNRDGKSKLREYAEAHQLQKLTLDNRTWPNPPRTLSVDDGIPNGVALRMYGNTVVPLISEFIGQCILQVEMHLRGVNDNPGNPSYKWC